MASNAFGNLFKVTTWGESHGPAIGVVIDGCPADLEIAHEDIQKALAYRAPGRNAYTTPRAETDRAEILSGVFEGKTTGAPISILIRNQDADSSKYEAMKHLLRPGHANFTYLEKYGICDYKGGGRSSARETACRVAAGAVAKKLLSLHGVEVVAYVKQVYDTTVGTLPDNFHEIRHRTLASPVFCPDADKSLAIQSLIESAKASGDSYGGIVEFVTTVIPVGWGDPVYQKIEAALANAMMSIPASKGFEIGSGFACVSMRGSEHNDAFVKVDGRIQTATNHAGGVLGGITTGMPLIGRVAFKPTSSIRLEQSTVDIEGNSAAFKLSEGSRHDPCVAIRAVPVVEAMVALVLVDALLANRTVRI